MFSDLVPTGEGYRSISEAISAACDVLDVEKPDRLRQSPIRTMDGHMPVPSRD